MEKEKRRIDMAERINLENYRKKVDSTYVGFAFNGDAIKPVHVSSGAQRCVYGSYNTSKKIKHLALVSDSKGNIPPGNELETIFAQYSDDGTIEDGISMGAVESMRNVMQKLVSADKGVYVLSGLEDKMLSFTAGSKYFLTASSIYEDTGEFIGGLVCEYCPELAKYIKELLDKADDPISLLFEPILEGDMKVYEKARHQDLPAFKKMNTVTKWYIDGLKESGICLLSNFKQHSNPLTQLRLFNFFCIFHLIRYMSMLEAFYCEEKIRPILLDFSRLSPSVSSVARASEMSYTQMYKSINRFYAWGYSQLLDDIPINELMDSETPVYKENKKASNELNILWEMAKERTTVCKTDDEKRLTFGEIIYDMLAIEASSHPIDCLKRLGTSSGILYPPDQMHPNKRFVLSQDILEMVLRSTVMPGEIISGSEIRKRLWDRFGIIVGGSSFELEHIQESGVLLQVDEDSLEQNFVAFSELLEAMDFAEVMADGILQIRLGGAEA